MLAAVILTVLLWPSVAVAQASARVTVTQESSLTGIQDQAQYWFPASGERLSVENALAAFERGDFSAEAEVDGLYDGNNWGQWIAIRAQADEANTAPLRRQLAVGGIFWTPPEAWLIREGAKPELILADDDKIEGDLPGLLYNHFGSKSFALEPGEKALLLLNTAATNDPSLGLFREGDLVAQQFTSMSYTMITYGFLGAIVCAMIVLGSLRRDLELVLLVVGCQLMALQPDLNFAALAFDLDDKQANTLWRVFSVLALTLMIYVGVISFLQRRNITVSPLAKLGWMALILIGPQIVLINAGRTQVFIFIYVGVVASATAFLLKLATTRASIVVFAAWIFTQLSCAALRLWFNWPASDLGKDILINFERVTAATALMAFGVITIRNDVRERLMALETKAETDRRLLETEREFIRARELATQRKERLAAASHDIRQPIFGLRAALESEADRLSLPLQARLSDAIAYLEQLTKQYSDKDESLGSAVEPDERTPLNLVVETTAKMFAPEAKRHGIDLKVIKAEGETAISGFALIRSCSNLLANALRHSGASEVTIEVFDGPSPEIVVRDNGVGMDPATLAKVQSRGGKSESSSGDGLGLAIIHELASEHGFIFVIGSQKGRGTQGRLILS